jgi:hypothetical protein
MRAKQAIEIIRDGLIEHLKTARPEELIRIVRFIEDDPEEMRRGLIRELQRQAAARLRDDETRQGATEKSE